jgi:hypothetical protein
MTVITQQEAEQLNAPSQWTFNIPNSVMSMNALTEKEARALVVKHMAAHNMPGNVGGLFAVEALKPSA